MVRTHEFRILIRKFNLLSVSGNVSPLYRNFLIYTSLSNCICGIESVLSSYSMLDATGVGKMGDNAVPLAAISLNLIGKDILGQVLSVPITSLVSSYGDKNPVKYTRFNVLTFEISNLLEYITPLLPSSYFILFAATGNIGKNIGYNGFGSFMANAINNLSVDKNNISEIHSKVTSSVQLSYSFGMMIGLGIVNLIPCYYTRMSLLPIFGLTRYYAMVRSIKGLI